MGPSPGDYEARLARRVLVGAPDAAQAAMALLEHCEPATIDAAVALVAGRNRLTVGAFDRVADAWETYRHLKNLPWD